MNYILLVAALGLWSATAAVAQTTLQPTQATAPHPDSTHMAVGLCRFLVIQGIKRWSPV